MIKKGIALLVVLALLTSSLPIILVKAAGTSCLGGLWHFDEGTGSITYDSTGNGNTATITGALWASGKMGKALDFDGVDDYVEAADSNSLDITGKLTLEAWIFPRSYLGKQVIVCKYNHSSLSSSYYLSLGGTLGATDYPDRIYFALTYNGNNYYAMVSNTAIPLNTWTHVAATSNTTHMSIYLNGVRDKTRAYPPGTIYAGTANLRIGCYLPEFGYARCFDGVIDEVRVVEGTIWTVDDDNVQCPNADFASIQAAVNAAAPEDTIIVHDGTYVENVNINKPLTLKSASKPIIDGNQAGPCITVSADGVTVEGFELRNGAYGIASWGTDHTVISDNVIHDILNVPGNAGCGIMFWSDSDDFDSNIISYNEIFNCDRQGIYLGGTTEGYISEENQILGNTIYDNGLYTLPNGPDASAYGIQLSYADHNIIKDNEIFGHDNWFYYPGFDFAQGVYLFDSNHNTITNNYLCDNNYGVGLYHYFRAVETNYINYNNIAGNTGYGVCTFDGSPAVGARFNWWGDSSGPTHSSNTGGVGDAVSDNVDYSPWLGATFETTPRTYHVNPTGTIQEAIDEASSGDTVMVHEGTYTEQLTINKDLTVRGLSGATIVAPTTRKTYTIPEGTAVFDPIVLVYGGTESNGAISGSETITAIIDCFEIDGGNKASAAPVRYVGILCRNVKTGLVSNNNIHGMYDADGEGNGPQTFGILIYGDSDVVAEYNEVREFSRGGIVIQGDGGLLLDPTAIVQFNSVIGNGLEVGTGWWAENGIQVSYGAGGTVANNTVSNCQVNNPSWASTGILIVDADDGVNILDNSVADCDVGVSVSSPSYDLIQGNVISNCNWEGIRLGWPVNHCTVINNTVTQSWAGIGVWDASDNMIDGNMLQGNEYGIYMDGDSHNNVITWNYIIDNLVDGIYVEPYGGYDPSGTQVHYNCIAGNGGYGIYKDGSEIINATLNWWGDASGPYHETSWMYMGQPCGPHYGSGDDVGDYVLYYPWLNAPSGDPVEPPTASFTFSPSEPKTGETVAFDASSSTSNGGLIVTYEWDFGDGNTTSTVNAIITHVFDSEGVYNVTLVVTDSEGLNDSTWQLVEVKPSVVINHDVAIIDVAPFASQVYQGWTMDVDVTVANLGDVSENFSATLYANSTFGTTVAGVQNVLNLAPNSTLVLHFHWNTTGTHACYNYTLPAVASTVVGETNTGNNTFWNGDVHVVLVGDANGDGYINGKDAAVFGQSFGSRPGDPKWSSLCDLNQDGYVNAKDVVLLGNSFGAHCI